MTDDLYLPNFSILRKKIPITYKVFTIDRKEWPDEETLQIRINKLLSQFVDEHIDYFFEYDKIILYDDRRHSANVADIYNPKWCRT